MIQIDNVKKQVTERSNNSACCLRCVMAWIGGRDHKVAIACFLRCSEVQVLRSARVRLQAVPARVELRLPRRSRQYRMHRRTSMQRCRSGSARKNI